jgi:hypothetical protein
MKLYLVWNGELSEEFECLVGDSRPAHRHATSHTIAGYLLREGGGAGNQLQTWRVLKANEVVDDHAFDRLVRKVKDGLAKSRRVGISFSEIGIPLHALQKVAEEAQARVIFEVIFEDSEATRDEEPPERS